MPKKVTKEVSKQDQAVKGIESALEVFTELSNNNPDTVEYKQVVDALKDALVYAQ